MWRDRARIDTPDMVTVPPQPCAPRVALLVEDDAVIRDCVAAWLADLGWLVTAVATAEDALVAVRDTRCAIAVVDVKLQGARDGVWLAGQLQQQAPLVSVVFATGIEDLPGDASLRPNVRGYLVKPYSRRDLQRVLAAVPRPAPPAVLGWPPRVRAFIATRRMALFERIREAVRWHYRTDERLAATIMAGTDPDTLTRARLEARAVARRVGLDVALTREVERAVCFCQIGREVLPTPADAPELAPGELAALVARDMLAEGQWALDALGMPIAGDLLARTALPPLPVSAARTPIDHAADVLRGVLVWRESLADRTAQGSEPRQAALDALMHVRDDHAAIDPAVADAIEMCALAL